MREKRKNQSKFIKISVDDRMVEEQDNLDFLVFASKYPIQFEYC